MSTLIGIKNSKPFMHMTSDVKTKAQLETSLYSTTLFHSDLPYVFAREQWTIDSYTDWNGTGGGRKFAIPTDLQTFKSSNPDLAYMLVLEDGSGNKTILNPLMCTVSSWYSTTNGTYAYCTGTIGAEYSAAFVSSDAQLSALTTNTYNNSTISVTFRTWDSADTTIAIFRNRAGEYFKNASNVLEPYGFSNYATGAFGTTYIGNAKNMTSNSLDITKVHVVFLNVTNATTSFSVQTDYDDTAGITLSNDGFSVGGLDLIQNVHLLTHGVYNNTDTVTPLIGTLAGTKTTGFSRSSKISGMVASNGAVQDNNTPVIEIPDESTGSTTVILDFNNQEFYRGSDQVFSSAAAAKGLIYSGYKEIDISLDSGTLTPNTNTVSTISTTQTGSFTGSDANTLYLMTLVFSDISANKQATALALCSTGDTAVFSDTHYHNQSFNSYSYGLTWMINIATDGTVTAKLDKYTGANGGVSSYSVDWGDIKVRLIALNPA